MKTTLEKSTACSTQKPVGLLPPPMKAPRSSAPHPKYSQAKRAAVISRVTSLTYVEPEVATTNVKPALTVTKPLWSAPSGQAAVQGICSAPLIGRPEPMGATPEASLAAVNFVIFSSNASAVTLCLFSESDLQQGRVTCEVALDPVLNRTGDLWHIMLPGVRKDLLYGYKLTGPEVTQGTAGAGQRFDPSKVLLDPYAKTIISRRSYGQLAPELAYGTQALGHAATWPQHAATLPSPSPEAPFDWEGDRPLNIPMEQLVIYEMHVRGFTQDKSSGVSAPGTYQGMIERLDYLQKLGVNAVELLPTQEFNELEYYSQIPGSDAYRFNFWGYSTVGYFAPMARYSDAMAKGKSAKAVHDEFKTMVRECHKRGIEVIMDVVFNHTAEGNDQGLTLSFRGLDNRIYYMLAPGGEYYNYSGCGNTFNCNHPVVRQFILDCLRYWVQEYHVDGFRFDLASILTRAPSAWHPQTVDPEGNPTALQSGGAIVNEAGIMTDGAGVPTGTPLPDPPLIEIISEDPVLRNTKMIAEAWDCDGLNQVGAFPHYGGRWAEWNGSFRDTVRQFIKGTDGPWAGSFASALCGSPNLYKEHHAPETDWWATNGGRKWKGGRTPSASINFVTAHDGFTLADLVSYNEKHNDANGENNRDGENHNSSWNCGEEGPARLWPTKRLRQRQMRNFASALMLAHGVPMLNMGDEYGHTKSGNNNTYCHDSALNWFNWSVAQRDEQGLVRFMRHLINFRKDHPELQRTTYVTDKDVQWHGEFPNTPDWTESSRLVAFTLSDGLGGGIFVAFNTAHTPKVLSLPRWGGRVWRQLVDTSKVAPFDFLVADEELSAADVNAARAASAMWTADHTYPMLPWSCIILESVLEDEANLLRAVPASKPARRA